MTKRKPAKKNGQEPENKAESTEENHKAGYFPIVGIGASAGGLAAFEAFFSGMPADKDPDMAFVLVQHLAPDHKSILSELIRRYTRMQVFEVEDGMKVNQNCAYIIPPNRDMAFLNGHLQLLEPVAPRGQRLPIDFFFRSLAQDQHERAICVVLSGTGSDGAMGLRAIKGEGGMAMVQTPESTEYDGMPRNALATGLVDYELPPAEMAAQLMAYASQAFGRSLHQAQPSKATSDNFLKKIFVLLRAQTGHDFSHYKPNTINRRIERRMAVHQLSSMEKYVRFIQKTPLEVESLFRDLLIGVTNFFRDPEAFEVLETQVIPKLFARKPSGSTIRIWSTGCSTGDEAYSIAILVQEFLDTVKQGYKVQIFATDIDSQAIALARTGQYPSSIAVDISPQRLSRFFTADPKGTSYRINKNIRDLLIFSEQSVIKDPPFSKLDLISCRNLLIYMGGELQKKLIPLFHYALKPGGFLFLGTSETVGDYSSLFSAVDRKQKVYQRQEDFKMSMRPSFGQFLPPILGQHEQPARGIPKARLPETVTLRELTEQAMLKHFPAVGALVDKKGQILYLHGRTGMYLEPPSGEVGIANILKMAREGLQRELTTALHKVVITKETLSCHDIRVKTNGSFTLVNMTLHPVYVPAPETKNTLLYLVILEEPPESTGHSQAEPPSPDDMPQDAQKHIMSLEQELRAKEEYLQTTNEELETSNEELKSSNEEMQSVNEELQSTNEELETSKEELQSVNEELSTVNAELQSKVLDLSRANNDMNNLLAGTGIGTVFVDHQLRILRFTPTATKIINFVLSDVGRPVGHFVPNLVEYDSLVDDVRSVLATLISKEVEVQTLNKKWYSMKIQPYRTLDNVIEGAVITFVDISEVVQMRELLRKTNELMRLAVVVRDSSDAITVHDLDGHIMAWNPGAVRLYGWSEAEAMVMNVRDRIPPNLQADDLEKFDQLVRSEFLEPYTSVRLSKDGRALDVWITATSLVNEAGKIYGISTTERVRR